MSKYNFDDVANRRGSSTFKWEVKDNELPMWVADMDFHVLPEVRDAIIERNKIDSYGYVACPKEYFEAHAKWWNKRHHVNIKPNEMVFCSGVVAAIDSIFKHLLQPGDGVLVFTPVYHVFFNCIKNNKLKEFDCELVRKGNEYYIDFDRLEEILSEESIKCILLCNPHNPVGKIFSIEDLKRISDLAKKYHALILSDEIHCDITEPGKEYNSIFLVDDGAIALWSVTKSFNLAAIQCSVIACKNKELLNQIESGVGQDDVGEPNYFAPFAAIAALEHGDVWNKEMCEYVFNNKNYISDFIKERLPKLSLVDNKATYLLWIDILNYSTDSDAFAKGLRDHTGLFVSSGKQFGKGGDGYLRINVATSLKNVKDACERLEKYVKTL